MESRKHDFEAEREKRLSGATQEEELWWWGHVARCAHMCSTFP